MLNQKAFLVRLCLKLFETKETVFYLCLKRVLHLSTVNIIIAVAANYFSRECIEQFSVSFVFYM